MKNTLLSFGALLLMQCLQAQPVLTSDMHFAVGDTYRIDGFLNFLPVDPGPPGENQVWIFQFPDGEELIEGEPAIAVDPSGTPFADSTAVMASDICIRSANNPNLSAYQYYANSPSYSNVTAMGWFEAGNTSFGNYDPPYNYLVYPLEYGDTYEFTYDYLGYHLDFGYYYMRDSGYVHVQADAWGHITTPLGEFSNVLRLKSTIESHFWYRYEAGEPWTFIGKFTDIEYHWFHPEIKAPLMIITEFEDRGQLPADGFLVSGAPPAIIRYNQGASKIKTAKNGEAEFFIRYLADYDFDPNGEEDPAAYEQQGFAAAGGDGKDRGGSVSYSIGQVAYQTASSSSGSVSEGIQQAYEIFLITSIPELATVVLDIAAYPNPVRDLLVLSVNEDLSKQNLVYQLTDMKGSMLYRQVIHQPKNEINMRHLPAGTYFLQVTGTARGQAMLFKIIKH